MRSQGELGRRTREGRRSALACSSTRATSRSRPGRLCGEAPEIAVPGLGISSEGAGLDKMFLSPDRRGPADFEADGLRHRLRPSRWNPTSMDDEVLVRLNTVLEARP